MTEQQPSLLLFYQGWDTFQQRLIEAIAPLTSEQLALRLPGHWSIAKIAAHIIAARVWWLHTRAGEGNSSLAPLEHWDGTGQPVRSTAELVDGLERTRLLITDVLTRWTPADLFQVLEARPDDPIDRTRQWIIYHVLEHDVFHGGELSGILGAHGLTGVTLE